MFRSTRAIFPSDTATSICRLIWLAGSITCPPLRIVSYRGVSCAREDAVAMVPGTRGVERNSLLFMVQILSNPSVGSERDAVRQLAPGKSIHLRNHTRSH